MTGGGIRAARNLSAAAVATIAAWSSYYHMVHVALRFGERPEVAYALPFSVDGMLVVATIVMVDDKRRAHRVRPMARLAFAAGVIASIATNIAAAHPTIGARIVDAWPALALLLVVEMLARPPATAATETSAAAPTIRRGAELTNVASTAQVPAEVPPSDGPFADVPPVRELPSPVAEVPPAVGMVSPAPGSSMQGRHLHLAAAPAHRSPVGAATTSFENGRVAELPADAAAEGVAQPEPTAAQIAAEVPVVTQQVTATAAAEVLFTAEPAGADAAAEVPVPVQRSGVAIAAGGRQARRDRDETATRRDRRQRKGSPTADGASHGAVTRRPTATTRRLALGMLAAEPHLSRAEVADRLGVSARRLREVLAA
jgi:hypothetical protein